MELTMDFEKTIISRSVGIFLQENLQQNDVETLNRVLRGKKAQYHEANSLLRSVLQALVNQSEGEDPELVIEGGDNPADDLSQELTQQEQRQEQSLTTQIEEEELRPYTETKSKVTTKTKKKELCRFYARGRCNRNKDCRFGHPDVCRKFKTYGSKSTDKKGCDGKCNDYHPNTCRSSLNNRTCSYEECRFFHLKGTKRSSLGHTGSSGQNWRANKDTDVQARSQPRLNKPHWNNDQGQTSKNERRQFPDLNPDPQTGNAWREDPVLRSEERRQWTQTLEVIMRRLTAMEARQPVYIHPAMNQQPTAQPMVSPAVQLPGTQTQNQWASQNQWPQTQF